MKILHYILSRETFFFSLLASKSKKACFLIGLTYCSLIGLIEPIGQYIGTPLGSLKFCLLLVPALRTDYCCYLLTVAWCIAVKARILHVQDLTDDLWTRADFGPCLLQTCLFPPLIPSVFTLRVSICPSRISIHLNPFVCLFETGSWVSPSWPPTHYCNKK